MKNAVFIFLERRVKVYLNAVENQERIIRYTNYQNGPIVR